MTQGARADAMLYGMTAPHQLDPLHMTIGAFFEVYNRLGYGFLESHYAAALERELRKAGLRVAREYATQVWFKDEPVGFHRLDMVVNESVVVEIKATPLMPSHAWQQLRSYLRATSLDTGVLLHFGPRPRFYKMTGGSDGMYAAVGARRKRPA